MSNFADFLKDKDLEDNQEVQEITAEESSDVVTGAEEEESTDTVYEVSFEIPNVPSASEVDCGMAINLSFPAENLIPTLLILTADVSGSMAGKPIEQVKDALEVALEEKLPHLTTKVIFFNHRAFVYDGPAKNIRNLTPKSTTSFSRAFESISEQVDLFVRKNPAGTRQNVVIVFMSDGNDTCGGPGKFNPVVEALRTKLAAKSATVSSTFHSIAFSASSDAATLLRFKDCGCNAGTFQFCEQRDGRALLREKMLNALSTALSLSSTFTISLPLKKSDDGPDVHELTVPLDLFVTKNRLMCTITKHLPLGVAFANIDTSKPAKFVLRLENGAVVAETTTSNVSVAVLNPTETEAMLLLRSVDRTADALLLAMTKTINNNTNAAASTASNTATAEFLARCQKEIDALREKLFVFQRSEMLTNVSRSRRDEVFLKRKDIFTKFNALSALIAKGTWSSSTAARVADIKFISSFPEGRQRRVNSRIVRNAKRLLLDDKALAAIPVSELTIPQASADMYTCIISYCSWGELIASKDIVGFGLNVLRPEFVVEDPTQIRVNSISLSVLSWDAMVDAVKNAVMIKGQDVALGNFGDDGACMTGALKDESAKFINAWLPLYLHEKHWELVKILTRQVVGFFIVLDPLAYSRKQIEALFMVLLVQLSNQSRLGIASSKGRNLMVQFHRTCFEYATMFKYRFFAVEMINKVGNESPFAADQFKTLPVLTVMLLLLQKNDIEGLFPTRTAWERFWCHLLILVLKNGLYRRTVRLRRQNRATDAQKFAVFEAVGAILGTNNEPPKKKQTSKHNHFDDFLFETVCKVAKVDDVDDVTGDDDGENENENEIDNNLLSLATLLDFVENDINDIVDVALVVDEKTKPKANTVGDDDDDDEKTKTKTDVDVADAKTKTEQTNKPSPINERTLMFCRQLLDGADDVADVDADDVADHDVDAVGFGFPSLQQLLVVLKYTNFWIKNNFYRTPGLFASVDANFGVLVDADDELVDAAIKTKRFSIEEFFDHVTQCPLAFAADSPASTTASPLSGSRFRAMFTRAAVASAATFNVSTSAKTFLDDGHILEPFNNPMKTLKEMLEVAYTQIKHKANVIRVNARWELCVGKLEANASVAALVDTLNAVKYSDGSRFSYQFKCTFSSLFLRTIPPNIRDDRLAWLGAVVSGKVIVAGAVTTVFPTIWLPGKRYMKQLRNAFGTDVYEFIAFYLANANKLLTGK